MKTISKIIFTMTMFMCIAAAQVPLLNRVGTTIYPWRPGDKFSDSLLSANAALLNKNNVFTGAVNTFNVITLSTALDTAYSNSVSNILATAPLSVATSGRAKFLSLSNLGSMYYVDSAKYHGSASINTVGALASGSIAPGFGSINIGSNTINSGALTSTGQISGKIGVFGAGMNVALKPLVVNKFNGAEVFSVDTVGNVALSLNSKLYLSGFTNDYFLQFSSGRATLSGGNQTIDGVDIKGSGFIDLYTRNIARLRVDSSGNVGIGASSPPSTAKLAVKAGLTANIQEWYRSASNTVIASIDTNGSVLFNNTANVSTRFYWDATANGGAGGLILSYLYVDRLAQKATDLQVGSITASGGTYFIAGLGNNSNNAFTFSSPFDGTGISISSTGYLNIKATNQKPNIQEWYRSANPTPVALVDTTGLGQFARLKIGGAAFARIDSAKIVGDTLKYYVNGVAYNSVRGSNFGSLSLFLLLGAGLWLCVKKMSRVRLYNFAPCREMYSTMMIFLSAVVISVTAFSQEKPQAGISKRDSTLSLSVEKFDARVQELQGELEKQIKTKDQAQKVLHQTEDNIKALQSAIQAMLMVKQDTTLHIQSKKK